MDFSMSTNELRAYIAGIFDGEGYITMEKRRRHGGVGFTMKAGVVNTCLPLLELLKLRYDGCISKGNKVNKQCYNWSCSQDKASDFLSDIYPFVNIKRFQASIALDYIRDRKTDKTRVTDEELEYRENTRLLILAANKSH